MQRSSMHDPVTGRPGTTRTVPVVSWVEGESDGAPSAVPVQVAGGCRHRRPRGGATAGTRRRR